jgi:hypothetical protein
MRPGCASAAKYLCGEAELELVLIHTRMIQKPLLWVEVGKSACVLVGICGLRLNIPCGEAGPGAIWT